MRPEGETYEECFFKWGPVSNPSENEAQCEPEAAAIPPGATEEAVSAPIAGLAEATEYRFHLYAKSPGVTQEAKELSFETAGPPVIEALRASGATQSAVTLEADVNTRSLDTSYRFEWGPSAAYGHTVTGTLEATSGTVRATAPISGLAEASTYHFRIFVENEAGEETSEDATAETLNSCGLPEGRCFELVSERDPGPFSIPGEYGTSGTGGVEFQAAPTGPGALAYPVESGYPDATKGATTLYLGRRDAGDQIWGSTQLSPPVLGQNEKGSGGSATSVPSGVYWLSKDLSCGFTQSWRLLTEDPAMRLAYEAGGSNLYRINPDGTYDPVTYLAPENPDAYLNSPIAGSQDCSKLVFKSAANYPGIPADGTENLYEWEEGTLRNAAWIPGPSGAVAVAAVAGRGTVGGVENAVSEDGSRVFFSAKRLVPGHAGNSGEVGKTGIFARIDGTETLDVSASETATPDEGATYQWATADGSKVFFTANHGLTAESSTEGADLYQYDLGEEELTDLTATTATGGAQVTASSAAPKTARPSTSSRAGQLVAGKGRTLAENERTGTESIYRVAGGETSFIATIPAGIAWRRPRAPRSAPKGATWPSRPARTSPAMRAAAGRAAYLYDAAAGAEGKTTCVSCRPDGQPPAGPAGGKPLYGESVLPLGTGVHPLTVVRYLAVSGGQPHLFFYSYDALAPGAIEGQNNVYEWAHGQVFRLTGERGRQYYKHPAAVFAGASEDGSDAYIFTPETLSWEDGDERISVYDARVGGGFAEPAAPAAPCDPDSEGSCQGGTAAGPAAVPGAASKDFAGPGNVKAKKHKHKKAHKKKRRRHHHKKRHHGKKHKGKNKKHHHKKRHAKQNRRAGR